MRAGYCAGAIVALVVATPTTWAWPTLSAPATMNLGTPLVVQYDLTDGLDGRLNAEHATERSGAYGEAIRQNVSPSGNDWIGLFPAEGCPTSVDNNQERHNCHIAWKYVAANAQTGTVTFEADEYKNAGDYQLRYFYGDDPTIVGTYDWLRQGWVCNSYSGATQDVDGDRPDFTQRAGMAGTPEVFGALDSVGTKIQLEMSQCQCNADLATQTIAYQSCTESPVADASVALTQEQCVSSCSHTGSNNEELDQAGCTGLTWNGDTRVWTTRSWGNTLIDQDTCLSYRAACARCFRDPVAFSGTVSVTGPSGVDTYQDMSGIPGFEIGFP